MNDSIWSIYHAFGDPSHLIRSYQQRDVAAPIRRDIDGVAGTVAIIDVSGTLTKFETSQIRGQVRAAAANDSVGGILLAIHSPGGSVAGTFDLVSDIRSASGTKPTVAFIEDLGASAAFAIASAADRIIRDAVQSGRQYRDIRGCA